jgi:hypothetical protein
MSAKTATTESKKLGGRTAIVSGTVPYMAHYALTQMETIWTRLGVAREDSFSYGE